jgi:tetratricopeptide (TPR) repeat protein
MAGSGFEQARVAMSAALTLAAFPLLPGEVQAQDLNQQQSYCINQGGGYAVDLQIGGCTALIQSGRTTASDLPIIFFHRGNAYIAQGDYVRAVADFDQAIRLNPQYADAFFSRARAYDAQRDYVRSIADYDQAIRLDSRDMAMYSFVYRGNAYAAQGDYVRAIADYDQTIRLSPQYAFAFFSRARAYAAQRDYVRAIADFGQAIQMNPQYAEAFYYRGVAYDRQRDYARAIADYDQAIRLTPNNAALLNTRCWARAVWGQQLDQALADCDASLRIANNPSTLDSRGLVHLRRSAWQAAFADYDAAVRGDANLIGSLYGRGIARLRLGQTAEGQADIAAASARNANVAAEFAGYGVRP